MRSQSPSLNCKKWTIFFVLLTGLGMAALVALARVPADPKNSLLLGFSASRLVMMAGLLVLTLVTGAAAVLLGLERADWLQWTDPVRHPGLNGWLIGLSALLALVSALALFWLRYADPERWLPFLERVQPLLVYLLLAGAVSALWLLFLRQGLSWQAFWKRKPVYVSAALIWAILLVVMLFVKLTGLGVTLDPAYWGEPGVAIQAWMLGLVLLGGLAALLLGLWLARHSDFPWTDWVLALVIWSVAVGIWLSVPTDIVRNSFYMPITPPGDQPYPISDAGFYDYASQNLLLGYGYVDSIPPRPLYILFLAGLHSLFGQRYDLILTAQTLVLALFPVVLYWLGRRLHSRTAGVVVALLAIFRELTSILISSETRVSNTRMLLTDLPTALVIALAALLVLRWLQRKDQPGLSPLLAGCCLGVMFLLRTQSILILPFVVLLAFLVYGRRYKQWFLATVLVGIGIVVTISPWMAHNYRLTGKFTFDNPSQIGLLSSQYSTSDNLSSEALDPSESLSANLLSFMLSNPGYVAGFVTNHFLATEIDGLLALPLIERFDGLSAPINLYWMDWAGQLTWYNSLLVILYLGLIALGIGTAWRRLSWAGLVPLGFNLGYALSNGVARFSGWRYDLPADWVPYFYFGLGIAELLAGAALLFNARSEDLFTTAREQIFAPTRRPWLKGTAMLAGFALLGALPWIAEASIPPHFADLDKPALLAQLAEAPGLQQAGIDQQELDAYASQEGVEVRQGRLLYPRFYWRNNGMRAAHPWAAFAPREYPRVGFIMIGERFVHGVIRMSEIPSPSDFPQASDVIVLGCRQNDQTGSYLDVTVLSFDGGQTYFGRSLDEPCSP
jgi:4-amino-4-deoxy-L-arabinose transferase-like glycosyltransferase